MKKGLTIAALSALSLSAVAVAPAQQASAAETTPTGFYNIQDKTFTSLTDFKKLSKAAKKALFGNSKVYFVSSGTVIKAFDIISKTNAELKTPEVAVPQDKFEADNGKIIAEINNQVNVDTVTATNGTVTVKLSKEVTADTVTVADFTVTQKIGSGEAKAVTPSKVEVGADKKTVTITVAEVKATDAEQSVVTSVAYKNTAAKSAEAFKVAAVAGVKVESVSAINLKQVEVKFNQAVDKTTATDIANYTLSNQSSGGTAVVAGSNVVLSEDGKTATIYLATKGIQQETFDLTIENVKSADKTKTIAKSVKSVKLLDTVLPTVSDVQVIGKNQVEVTLSEAMNTAPTIKVIVNGVTYTASASFNSNNTKAVVTLSSDLPAGTVQVEVSGGADYAGYAVEKVTKDVVVSNPTDAPTAQITEVKDTQVTIKFNRPIKSSTFDGNANAYIRHTYNTTGGTNETVGTDSTVGGKNVTNPSGDNQTFVVDFGAPLAPGTSTVYVGLVSSTGTAIEDNFGNKFANASYTVNLTADVIKPVVNSVEATDAQTIKVVYSEKVDATTGTNGAKNPSNYVLKDKDGNQVAITSVSDATSPADNTSFKLNTASQAIAGGNYTLEIKNIQDTAVAKNTLDTVTKSFTVADKVAPTVNTTGEVISATKVRIKFSEAMDATSITNVNNYGVDSKAKITAAADNKSVIIDFADVTPAVNYTSGAKTINVGRVQDAAGNLTSLFSTTVNFSGTVSTVAAKEVQITALDKATIVVEDTLTVDAGAKLQVGISGTYADATVTSSQVVDGKTYITVTLPVPVTTDTSLTTPISVATGINSSGTLAQAASTAIKNAQGLYLNITATVAKDKLAPVVTARETGDSDKDGKIDTLKVTFSEALYADSVAASDFEVEGHTIKGVKALDAAAGTVTLELQEGIFNTDATPKVKVIGSVSDALGNASKAETVATASTDKAAPVIVSATLPKGAYATSGDTLVVTFSETVKASATFNLAAFVANIGKGTGGETALSSLAADTVNDINTTPSQTITLTEVGSAGAGVVLGDVINLINTGITITDNATSPVAAVDNATDVEVK